MGVHCERQTSNAWRVSWQGGFSTTDQATWTPEEAANRGLWEIARACFESNGLCTEHLTAATRLQSRESREHVETKTLFFDAQRLLSDGTRSHLPTHGVFLAEMQSGARRMCREPCEIQTAQYNFKRIRWGPRVFVVCVF